MNHEDYNAVRLDRVTDKEWREALDELTVYLNWRLAGKTKRGAHSEKGTGYACPGLLHGRRVVFH